MRRLQAAKDKMLAALERGDQDGARAYARELEALKAKAELNGRWGTLIKFDVERDRWQVDLGIDMGIKLFKACNLNPSIDAGTAVDADGFQTRGDGQQLMRHNDLKLPCSEDGNVDWIKVFPDFCNEFFNLQRQSKFCCSKCGVDISTAPGVYGYAAYMTSSGMWEEGHLINMVGDLPRDLQCLRCSAAAIPCKFYAQGYCMRGSECAYKH